VTTPSTRPFYSGKHRKHGMNLQVIASPGGDIVWVSGPLPGAVHDLTAARIWGITRELAACGLVVLGDKGYIGEDDIRTSYRGRNKPASQRRPTGLMPGCAPPASAPMPSSNPGASCGNSAAARGAPGGSPKRFTSSRPAKSEDVGSGAGAVAFVRRQVPQPLFPGFPLRAASLR